LHNVRLIVYDLTGRETAILVNQQQRAGVYAVDFSSIGLASGVYFYKLIVDDNYSESKKMVVLK
jgi:hypothetical protein